MRQGKKLLVVIFLVGLWLLSGCRLGLTSSPISPLFTESPLLEPALGGLAFSIDEPLLEGDVRVSGSGPQGLAIVIVDVTLMGEVLGRGRIGADGHFIIAVESPLVVNHRIGIMLDPQVPDIQYTEELVARLEHFRGDNAITIPHIGRVYDAASVQPH